MDKLMEQEENQADAEFYKQAFWDDAEGDDEFVDTDKSDESTSDSDISEAEDAGTCSARSRCAAAERRARRQ
jgi:hypothetical protein